MDHQSIGIRASTKRILSIISICFFLIPKFVFSQDINFEHVNRDNGLPINSVTCAEQDNKGFIWMGSMDGLVKFDGYNYKTFIYNYADSLGLPGHLVTQIICAENGLIYLTVYDNGFSILNPKTERFDNFRMEDSVTLFRENINHMVMDSIGNLWLGSNNGLLYFNTNTYELKEHTYIKPDLKSNTQSNNYISALAIDDKNNLYILGLNGLLTYYNTSSQKTKTIKYSDVEHESIFLFNSGHLNIIDEKLWISTENNGLFIYDIEKEKTIKHLIPNTIVSSIKKIDSQIWIATDGKGMYIADTSGEITNHLINNPYDPFSISSDAIYCISQSRDFTVWVGCYSTGLNLYNKSRHKFSSISDTGKKGRKLTNKSIICIESWKDSLLIIGTDGGGLNKLNLSTGKLSLIKSNNGILDNIVAKAICSFDENSFYIGTYGNGLYHCKFISPNKVQATQIKRNQMGKYKHIWWIHKISDTSLYLGYMHAGLSIYNPVRKTYKELDAFKDHNIHTIKKIGKEYWISSEQKGISICNHKGEVLRRFINDDSDSTSLSSNFILEFFQDSRGHIWLGSNNDGLEFMENPKIEKFMNINEVHGFPAEMITNIEEDAKGFLWISTNVGLIRFNPHTFISELFDTKDGLQGKKFNINSSFNQKFKTLYFGGVDGLSYFHPYQIQRNNIAPQIAVTRLLIDNKMVAMNDVINNRVILNSPIAYQSELTLSYKEDDFTLEFSGLHYESSSKNQYQYKLEGFDDDWISTKVGQPSARYTNLKKGNFTFMVKASNADNVWAVTPLKLPIKITPPFYLTNWFYVLIALFTIVLISLYIRYRTLKLSKDKKLLEKLIKERTKELEDKARTVSEQNEEISSINQRLNDHIITRDRIFSIIAHDLKTPLNAVISFSNLLDTEHDLHDEKERRKFIKIIHQTSRQMNSLILNLLHWANSQVGKIKVAPKIISLEDVFTDLHKLTEANAMDKCIDITFEANNTSVFADYEMLVTILRNLISNSLKFTNKGGIIRIESKAINESTSISVIDNGIGISKDQIENINKRETLKSQRGTENEAGTGLGLFLCKDFTERNDGQFIIENNTPKGTIVKTIFPTKNPK